MCRMISFLQCLLVAAAFREMLPAVGGGGEGTGSGEGSGILLQAVQNRETFSINVRYDLRLDSGGLSVLFVFCS